MMTMIMMYFTYRPNKNHAYYYIWLYNQLATNESRMFFQRLLIYCIHVTGARINVYDTMDGDGKTLLSNAKKEVVDDRYQAIANAPIPSEDELISLI